MSKHSLFAGVRVFMSHALPTMMVKGEAGPVRINVSDYDPETHELWTDEAAAEADKAEQKKMADEIKANAKRDKALAKAGIDPANAGNEDGLGGDPLNPMAAGEGGSGERLSSDPNGLGGAENTGQGGTVPGRVTTGLSDGESVTTVPAVVRAGSKYYVVDTAHNNVKLIAGSFKTEALAIEALSQLPSSGSAA